MTGIREIGESVANTVLERVGRGMSRVQERKPLPHDLLESEDGYLLVIDLPGTTADTVGLFDTSTLSGYACVIK